MTNYIVSLIMTGVFFFNFVAATAMMHVIQSKLGNLSRSFRWWAIETLTLESASAMASFLMLSHPDEKVLGAPVGNWVACLYAIANMQLFVFVIMFHSSARRWSGTANEAQANG